MQYFSSFGNREPCICCMTSIAQLMITLPIVGKEIMLMHLQEGTARYLKLFLCHHRLHHQQLSTVELLFCYQEENLGHFLHLHPPNVNSIDLQPLWLLSHNYSF